MSNVEPPPPGRRGYFTIQHAHEVEGSPAHAARVREWVSDLAREATGARK